MLAAMEAIQAVLHDAALPSTAMRSINLRFETADAGRDPDGITWHGVLRFRALTEAAA